MEVFDSANAIGYFLLASATVKLCLWLTSKSRGLPRHLQAGGERVEVGRVSRLFIYPIKSMGGIEVEEMRCEPEGPSVGKFYDRQFLLTTGENHNFVTARQVPKTLLIHPEISGTTLTLKAEGMASISINIEEVEKKRNVCNTTVHGTPTLGLDCGNEVAQWLDDFLGQAGYRLLYAGASIEKRSVAKVHEKFEEWATHIPESHKINYQDTSPFHLLTSASVDELNSRLSSHVTFMNFRPNIFVTGASEPFAENSWNRVYIGETEMTIVKLCGRCVFTTIDPVTASKSAAVEPLKTMRSFRKIVPKFGDSPCFGVNLNPEKLGVIKVGDPIYAVVSSPRLEP